MRRSVPILAAALLVAACSTPPSPESAQPTPRASGIDRTTFDTTVRPQDDFYRWVNGTWIDTTEIPPDRSRWGSFVELADRAEHDLREIVDGLPAPESLPANDPARQIADFYRSYMDTDTVERLGAAPVREVLAGIDAIDDTRSLLRWLGNAQRTSLPVPLGLYVDQDGRNAERYLVHMTQWGLGLPDRDYYLLDEERMVAIREAYRTYVDTLGALADQSDVSGDAVLRVERALAEIQWTRVRNRDREATYNLVTRAGAAGIAPAFDWDVFLEAAGVGDIQAFVVRQPDYVAALGTALATIDLADWKRYLKARVLDAAAPYLSDAFVQANFQLHGRTLSGTEALRPRWQRGIALLDANVGELLGRLYVERHFRPEAKARMEGLVDNLRRAFAVGIDRLEWMTPATRAEAHAKLAQFTAKIGYPARWKDYTSLEVHADDLVGNLARASELEYRRQVDKLRGPIDRDEWFMNPQTVNAYYNPSMNEIVFPAAILQPPFFDADADDAVNYGGIGAVIGHEISHGFDDQGRKSDGRGNLRDWWTEEDTRRFTERTRALVAQYSAFEPVEGLPINGELTLGENIGDVSGLAVAWQAYQLALGDAPAPEIDGFSGAQRFFIGWAQVWRLQQREEATRRQIRTDPHSPAEYRVIGTVRNLDAFHAAFDTRPGDAMYLAPEARIAIW